MNDFLLNVSSTMHKNTKTEDKYNASDFQMEKSPAYATWLCEWSIHLGIL